jgi:catechol 2,3-dioxygenase-like lactoylglutathione lyase family enzyme
MARLNYYTVGSNSLEKAKVFYDGLLGSIGMKPIMEHPTGGRVYGGEGILFAVLGPFDGKPATVGNGTMCAFNFDTTDEVVAFYEKALELGGTSEGGPGERAPGFFFAYFRDLDGNKLCGNKVS